jgi:hypothetical protein
MVNCQLRREEGQALAGTIGLVGAIGLVEGEDEGLPLGGVEAAVAVEGLLEEDVADGEGMGEGAFGARSSRKGAKDAKGVGAISDIKLDL